MTVLVTYTKWFSVFITKVLMIHYFSHLHNFASVFHPKNSDNLFLAIYTTFLSFVYAPYNFYYSCFLTQKSMAFRMPPGWMPRAGAPFAPPPARHCHALILVILLIDCRIGRHIS